MDVGQLAAQYGRLKQANAARDRAMQEVRLVRDGKMNLVFPDLFPEDGPIADKALVANMVDVAARDTSEVLAPLPTFNCSSSVHTTDVARKFADKRTKIANNYVSHARLQQQAYNAADMYVSYGFTVALVEIDVENQMPYPRFLDSQGTYVVVDRFNRIQRVYQCMFYDVDELCAMYPELESHIRSRALGASTRVEVVRVHDKDTDGLFMPRNEGKWLTVTRNPLGKVLAAQAVRPGLAGGRGQFDDVLAVQVAKARFALLALEAATKAVQAPIALPMDVQELSIGPDAVLKSATPQAIGRVGLDVPREAFAEQGALDQELRQGSRYPDARNGEVDGSIVTGRGVQALMSGFDTQIRTGQAMFAEMFTRLIELCFEVDEALWPQVEKTVRGNENGTPYEIKYKPARDINGDYSIDVQYGLMAGLDPNRALVFGLQARGDKLMSRDFLRRQMPFALDASQEEQKVDVEEMREALKQAVAGYSQALPILIQQGQNPEEILSKMTAIIDGRQKGKPIEKVISDAFTPKTPPPGVESLDASASPVPGVPGEAPPGGGMEGMDPMGRVRGVAPGQAEMGPGGKPDLQTLLAGLTGSGAPTLQANVQRRQPI